MEDVGAIGVNGNAFDGVLIDIAAGMRPLVNDKATQSLPRGQMGKSGSKESGTHYEVVVFGHKAVVSVEVKAGRWKESGHSGKSRLRRRSSSRGVASENFRAKSSGAWRSSSKSPSCHKS